MTESVTTRPEEGDTPAVRPEEAEVASSLSKTAKDLIALAVQKQKERSGQALPPRLTFNQDPSGFADLTYRLDEAGNTTIWSCTSSPEGRDEPTKYEMSRIDITPEGKKTTGTVTGQANFLIRMQQRVSQNEVPQPDLGIDLSPPDALILINNVNTTLTKVLEQQ